MSSSTRGCCSRPASTALVVPNAAMQRGPKGLFAWVVQPDNTATPASDRGRPDGRRSHDRRPRASTTASASSPAGNTSCRPNAPVSVHTARRRRTSAKGAHEHLRTVHPPPDRHHAADGGDRVCRHRRVPVPAGRPASASRLSDHPGHGDLAGRERRNDGDVGRRAARAAVRADSRRDAADLAERARRHHDRHPVRSQSQYRFGGARTCRRRSRSQARPCRNR